MLYEQYTGFRQTFENKNNFEISGSGEGIQQSRWYWTEETPGNPWTQEKIRERPRKRGKTVLVKTK